jgi:hypothetical protein
LKNLGDAQRAKKNPRRRRAAHFAFLPFNF